MSERECAAFVAAVEERALQGTLAARVEIDAGGEVHRFNM
jgi:hypothetical protein